MVCGTVRVCMRVWYVRWHTCKIDPPSIFMKCKLYVRYESITRTPLVGESWHSLWINEKIG